jgi:SAM-dependent methyltransferase
MAIGWIYLKFLNSSGIFRRPKLEILDIGCQNLYDIPEEEALSFVLENRQADDETKLRNAIGELSARSPWPRGIGEAVYFGEFAKLCGFEYLAYDIFNGDNIRVFDLNSEPAPDAHRGKFDCVFNFGTTEHVFNQYNAFKVIHDVTRVGGHMFHQVPAVGYINHGYWVYSPRTFSELAAANGYELRAFWITGPQGLSPLDPQTETRALDWNDALPENFWAAWQTTLVPNGLINALLRKTQSSDFRLSLDTTTSNAAPDGAVADLYRRFDFT